MKMGGNTPSLKSLKGTNSDLVPALHVFGP